MTIWLSIVSLMAGGLLAQHFKIVVLAPATFVIVVLAVAIGTQQASNIWSIILTSTIASLGMQIGYFLGMFFQYGLSALRRLRTSRSSNKRTRQGPSIYRRPIS